MRWVGMSGMGVGVGVRCKIIKNGGLVTYTFQSLCESNGGERNGLFESGLWSVFSLTKITFRGTMVRSEVCNSWCLCLES